MKIKKYRFLFILLISTVVIAGLTTYYLTKQSSSTANYLSNKKEAQRLTNLAFKKEKEGETSQAVSLLEKAIKLAPTYKPAKIALNRIESQASAGSTGTGGTEEAGSSSSGASSSSSAKTSGSSSSSGGDDGFKVPDKLETLLPKSVPGFERTAVSEDELGVFGCYLPLARGEVESMTVSIWNKKDNSSARSFLNKGSKVLFPDGGEDFTYKGYPAYFGVDEDEDEATFVWIVDRILFELYAKGTKGKPVELRDNLEVLAEAVPL